MTVDRSYPRSGVRQGPDADISGPKRLTGDKSYEVGYGKPPKHTRFVKGQ